MIFFAQDDTGAYTNIFHNPAALNAALDAEFRPQSLCQLLSGGKRGDSKWAMISPVDKIF